MFYPVYLNLKGKRVVVIGGGEVGERKVASLLDTGAMITVVSPDVTPRVASLANANLIELHRRPYLEGDCAGAVLVLSATDDAPVNQAVWKEAQTARVLVNTADEPALCDFIMPAVVRRGEVAVAISTGGTSPALAARLRRKLSRIIGREYGQLADLLARVRPEIRNRVRDVQDRKALHYQILDSDIRSLLRGKDYDAAERRLRQIIDKFTCPTLNEMGKTS